MANIHLKYIDDMLEAFAIKLKDVLSKIANPVRPVVYHQRTEHELTDSNLCPAQNEINRISNYCAENDMEVNGEKTKVMIFNRCRKYDYLPKLNIDGQELDVVEVQKLLGVIIQSNLKWHSNTAAMCSKGFARLWLLRRLKTLGATNEELLDAYQKQIRSVMEWAVPVWEPGLTKRDSYQIERVQKAACAIILGSKYNTYKKALSALGLETLCSRRKKLCLNFAKKAIKHPKFKTWFEYETSNGYLIRNKNKLVPVTTRTKHFKSSPLPFLTDMLNDYFAKKK